MSTRFSRARSVTWFGLALLTLLVGCGPADAERDAQGAQPAKPSAEALRLATHAGYATPAGVRQECLGRLVFDAPRDLEWGLSRPGLWSGDHFRFTENMHGDEEYVSIGGIKVLILAPAKWADVEKMNSGNDKGNNNALHEWRKAIISIKEDLAYGEAMLRDPSQNPRQLYVLDLPAYIERTKESLREYEALIASLEMEDGPIDTGLPQTLVYGAGTSLSAFMLRDGRIYHFMDYGEEGPQTYVARKKVFLDMLKRFRSRALYEVPKEPGVCIPHGFIADDGTTPSRSEVSFRFKDRPGVLYTLGALVSGEHGFEGEAAFLKATARAAGGGAGIGRDPQTVGPRQTKIGALPAWQGGLSLNVADSGKPALRSYSVYTATDGHPHSIALPAIRLNLRSFTREQEPSLKSDPPPFEESLERLDAVLKSIRLRPTNPVMPELKDVSAP